MDLTKPVQYRGEQLNNAALSSGVIVGTQINEVSISPVQSVGYKEKSALKDGMDVSDTYQSARTIAILAQTNGADRADLFDRWQDILYAFNPTLAFNDSPSTKGYHNLLFSVATNDTAFAAVAGLRFMDVFLRARPLASPAHTFNRDRLGGTRDTGATLPWTATLDTDDPRIYVQGGQSISLVGVTSYTHSPVYRTFGLSAMTIQLVTAALDTARTFQFNEVDANTTITLPVSAVAQTILWDGKLLTRTAGGVTTIRMDLVNFTGPKRPYAQAGLGINGTCSANVLIAGSALSWFEALP